MSLSEGGERDFDKAIPCLMNARGKSESREVSTREPLGCAIVCSSQTKAEQPPSLKTNTRFSGRSGGAAGED